MTGLPATSLPANYFDCSSGGIAADFAITSFCNFNTGLEVATTYCVLTFRY